MAETPTGQVKGSVHNPTRLDDAIERVASNRPRDSSRHNSASSSSRFSALSMIPNSADPVYTKEVANPLPRRRSMQSDRSIHSSESYVNAQLYNAMPPPMTEAVAQRQRHADEWADKGATRRVVQKVVNGVRQDKVIRKGVRDFNFARTLGEGSYSTVIAATDRQTLKEYAIKVLDKRHIIKEKKVKYVNIEKNTLFRLGDHPGVVRLYYTFQDESSLYFVLDLAANGELLGVLKKLTTFDEECTRYYSAQILDAIDYMHSRGVIHRDLKPENVLLDEKMRVKIADFGTAKLLDMPDSANTRGDDNGGSSKEDEHARELQGLEQSDRSNSFVGTAEYVSPELLTEKSTCKSSDLWALGCIIFQLLTGRPPFKAVNEYQTFQKIVHLDYTIPPDFPPLAADLVRRLLVLDPLRRMSVPEMRAHEFFAGVDWGSLWKIKAPRLRPYRPPQQPIVFKSVPPIARERETGSVSSQPISQTSSHTGQQRSSVSSPNISRAGSEQQIPSRPRTVRTESANPSELDLQYSAVLSLPSEHILRLGQVTVTTSEGDRLPRKFNRLLQRKKTRMLMVTTHGRCIYLDSATGDRKVRGEMLLTGPGTTTVRQLDARQCVVETPTRSFLYEDGNGQVTEWVQAIEEANGRVLDHAAATPYGPGDRTEEKRKSRIGFGQ